MIKLGIIVAMDQELRLLKEKMAEVTEDVKGGSTFYQGTLEGCATVLVCCGVGKVNAAVCTTLLCSDFQVTHVINSGVAGGVAKEIVPFDVVLSTEFVAHDVTPRISEAYFPNHWVFSADETLLRLAQTVCNDLSLPRFFSGRVATGDIYVESSCVKKDIADRTAPLCVEMEGQAIAQVCCIFQRPLMAVRCISDSADDSSNVDFEQFVIKASDTSASIVAHMAAKLK